MFKKDLLIPALIGLGLYTQNGDVSLCSNTTMILLLYILLQDHEEIEILKHRINHDRHHHHFETYQCYPNGFGRARSSCNPCTPCGCKPYPF